MRWGLIIAIASVSYWPVAAPAATDDEATHQSDHEQDVIELPEVHVHGLPLNKDQKVALFPSPRPGRRFPRRWTATVGRLDEG